MDASASEAVSPTGSPAPEKGTSPQGELLYQVHFMSNPIHLRQVCFVILLVTVNCACYICIVAHLIFAHYIFKHLRNICYDF